jgi:hypothetical protein
MKNMIRIIFILMLLFLLSCHEKEYKDWPIKPGPSMEVVISEID